MAAKPTYLEERIRCEEILSGLRERYGGNRARLKHVNADYYGGLTAEEKTFMVKNCPKVYGLSYTKLLEQEEILFAEYTLPKELTSDITLTTKLNGAPAKFRYNVDTTQIREMYNLIYNNWRAIDAWGDRSHIPVMATPESVAVRNDAFKNLTGNFSEVITIEKEDGLRIIDDFIHRCASYTSMDKIKDCIESLPKKADGSIILKRATTIDWSKLCIEGYFYELVIMARNEKEIEMFIRSKKCDMANFNRVTKTQG